MSETGISLSDMGAPSRRKKAERLASTQASQPIPLDPAISPAESTQPERKPEKRTVSGIDRNIAATQDVIDRIKAKIERHRADPERARDKEALASLEKTLANLNERMKILHRLRDHEVRHDDR